MEDSAEGGALSGRAVRLREPAADPASAVNVEPIEVPAPGQGEARLRMLFAPVNPADLNVLQGSYGRRPSLPAPVGIEGIGTVIDVGPGVSGLVPGDRVVPLGDAGTWASHLVVAVDSLFKVPAEIDARQAAMLRVNPATADRMLALAGDEHGADVSVAFNAANSGVGRCLLHLIRERGGRGAAFLRDPDRFPELAAAGGPGVRVFEDSERGAAEAADWLGPGRPRLALNAVGGDSALRLMSLLAPGGLHVTYGAMGRQPLKVPNRFLIFDDLRLRGFWLSRWLGETGIAERNAVYSRLAELMAGGGLAVPIADEYPLAEAAAAVEQAGRGSRPGKVLLAL